MALAQVPSPLKHHERRAFSQIVLKLVLKSGRGRVGVTEAILGFGNVAPVPASAAGVFPDFAKNEA